MMTDVNAAITLLERRAEKNFQALNGIQTYDLSINGASTIIQLKYMNSMEIDVGPKKKTKKRLNQVENRAREK